MGSLDISLTGKGHFSECDKSVHWSDFVHDVLWHCWQGGFCRALWWGEISGRCLPPSYPLVQRCPGSRLTWHGCWRAVVKMLCCDEKGNLTWMLRWLKAWEVLYVSWVSSDHPYGVSSWFQVFWTLSEVMSFCCGCLFSFNSGSSSDKPEMGHRYL